MATVTVDAEIDQLTDINMISSTRSDPQQTRRSQMQQARTATIQITPNEQSQGQIYQFLFGDDKSKEQQPSQTPSQNTQNRSYSNITNNDNTNTTEPNHSRQRSTASILGTGTPVDDADINATPNDNYNHNTPDGTGNEDNDTSMEGNEGNNNNNTNDNTNQNDNESQHSEHSPTHDSTSQDIDRAVKPYFVHWRQVQWYNSPQLIKFIAKSDIILHPSYLYSFIAVVRYMSEDHEFHSTLHSVIKQSPELFDYRCADFVYGTDYALYYLTDKERYYNQLFPKHDEFYYTNLVLNMPAKDFKRIMISKTHLLQDLMGDPNEAPSDVMDEYQKYLDSINVNNNDNTNNINSFIVGNTDRDTDMNQSGQGNNQSMEGSGNQGSKPDANQSGLGNVLIGNENTKTRPGNVSSSQAGTRGDRTGSKVGRQSLKLDNGIKLQGEGRMNPKHVIGTGNTGTQGAGNTQGDQKDNNTDDQIDAITNREFEKRIGQSMFDNVTKFEITFNHNNVKTPGYIIKYKNYCKRWYEGCKRTFKAKINDDKYQQLLVKNLTNSLAPSTREVFLRNQMQYETVSEWHTHFDELFDINKDFEKHAKMLLNYVSPAGVTVENYIIAFLEMKAINDAARESVTKLPYIDTLILKDDAEVYKAATLNLNPKIISDVTKHLIDNWDKIDWSWAKDNIAGFPEKPIKGCNLRNVHILHTGILNLADYIRSIQTTESFGTKHTNDSILTYDLHISKAKAKHITGDGTTNIGNQVNAMQERPFQKSYDKSKFKGGYRDKFGYTRKTKPGKPGKYNKAKKLKGYKKSIVEMEGYNKGYSEEHGEFLDITKNSEAAKELAKNPDSTYARDGPCTRCIKEGFDGRGHNAKWHPYLVKFRKGAIQRLRKLYYQKHKDKSNQQSMIQAKVRQGRGGKKRNGKGRPKGRKRFKVKKKKRENTNTVGALADQGDEVQRGGLVTNKFDSQIQRMREHNTNMINALHTVKQDTRMLNKAKADARGNASSSLSPSKQGRSNTKS